MAPRRDKFPELTRLRVEHHANLRKARAARDAVVAEANREYGKAAKERQARFNKEMLASRAVRDAKAEPVRAAYLKLRKAAVAAYERKRRAILGGAE